MHILIIPSEQFIPEYAPEAGIFQYHQAKILTKAGNQVGVLSVKQTFTILMILKALFLKLAKKKANNSCDSYTFFGLIDLMYKKMFDLKHFCRHENIEGIEVLRVDGFYYWVTADSHSVKGWVKAGHFLFEQYLEKYGRPDIIHTHNALFGGILTQEISRKYNIPYVLTEHSSQWARNEITSASLKSKSKTAYLGSKFCLAVSSDFSDKLNNYFGFDKFRVLPNVIDPFLENEAFEVNDEIKDKFIFFHLAAFKPVKDQLTLLKALKTVLQQNNNIELRIAGSGILENELKAAVAEMGIGSQVKFLGFLSRDTVKTEMAGCNAFVMSSLYETFCVVLIEAMLYGKPVIATNSGGPKDIVNDRVGLLVEKSNPDELANAMLALVTNYKNYSHEEIRRYVIDKFGADRFMKSISGIYKEALLNG